MRHESLFYTVVIVCAVLIGQGTASAGVMGGDGFIAADRFETAYFTVSIAPGVDAQGLARSLDAGTLADIMQQSPRPAAPVSLGGLGAILDGFYEWAGRVLDMHVAGYHGHIKVARSARQLQEIYRRLYGTSTRAHKGFYIYEENTLYIAAPDFTKEVMGHELGHVVVSNYFVVQPSTKAAEVLSGYIEFQLRKLMTARQHAEEGEG